MASYLANRLPTETLTRIIKNIIHVPTLASLARTSKYISEVTYPFLYSSFREVDDGHSLPNFLRTILLKPELAMYVKTYIGNNTPYSTAMELDFTPSDLILLYKAMKATNEYCPDIHEERWRRIRGGSADDLTALLLCLLPNLEDIHKLNHGNVVEGHPRLERMLRRAAENQEAPHYPLRKLKRVTLNGGMGEQYFPSYGLAIFQVLPFLAFPCVQELSCHLLMNETFPREEFGSHGVPGSIYCTEQPDFRFSKTSLSIKHAFVSFEELSRFLQLFVSLKRLEYDFRYQENPQGTEPGMIWDDIDFAPQRFLGCIEHLADSLEELILSEDRYSKKVVDPVADLPIPDMTALRKLKILQMPAHMLFGKHREDSAYDKYSDFYISELTGLFPESLEHLTITDCPFGEFAVLKQWASRELPKNLKSLNVVFIPATWGQLVAIPDFDREDCPFLCHFWTPNGVEFRSKGPLQISSTDRCPRCAEVELWKKDLGFLI